MFIFFILITTFLPEDLGILSIKSKFVRKLCVKRWKTGIYVPAVSLYGIFFHYPVGKSKSIKNIKLTWLLIIYSQIFQTLSKAKKFLFVHSFLDLLLFWKTVKNNLTIYNSSKSFSIPSINCTSLSTIQWAKRPNNHFNTSDTE